MNILITSLALGSLYCLIAICFIFYFTYGKFLNISILAYIAFAPYMASSIAGKDPGYVRFFVSYLATIVIVSVLAIVIDRVVFAQLVNLNAASKVIASTSILFMLLTVNAIIWPTGAVLANPIGIQSVNLVGTNVLFIDLISIFGAVFLLLMVWLFLNKTNMGRRVRAVSYDSQTAQAYGISRRSVSVAVGVVIGVLCTTTGILLASPGSPRAGVIGVAFFSLIALAAVIVARHNDMKICIIAAFVIAFAQTVTASRIADLNNILNDVLLVFNIETEILLGPTFADRFVPFVIALLALVLMPKRLVKES